MLQRFFIAYGGITVAFTLIAWAMRENGAAHPRNPAWRLLAGLRDFCLTGWLLIFGLIAGILIWEFICSQVETAKAARVARERSQEYEKIREQNRIVALEKEQAQIAQIKRELLEREQARLREEDLRRQIEEQKKKRTAKDAVKAALGDFL